MILIYSVFLVLISVYSYSLIDVNLTLFNNRYWEIFRGIMINLGYYQRELNAGLYLVIITLLFIFSLYFIRNANRLNPIKLGILTGLILLFSYPFLSHDLFNYIFDAKIITFYHKLPYFFRPQDFSSDPWLRFMHWTHRYYPYGPSFLLLSLIPSILSFNKFILAFFSFKLMSVVFYFMAVYCLTKMNKKWAMVFATHPLILIEGLINSHNDLIAASLGIIGLYLLINKGRNILSRVIFLISGGIKFNTMPFILFSRSNKKINSFMLILFSIPMGYLLLTREIQPWYFIPFFVFLPFFADQLLKFNFFSVGLLASSYFFIRFGTVDSSQGTNKNIIIFVFFTLNLFYLLVKSTVIKKPSLKTGRIILALIVLTAVISRFIRIGDSAVFHSEQVNYLNFISRYLPAINPNLINYIIPTIFLLIIIFITLTGRIEFINKVFFLLLIVSSQPLLYHSRFFSLSNFLPTALYLIFYFVLMMVLSRLVKIKSKLRYISLVFILVFFIINFVRYFSSLASIYSINNQAGIIKAVVENENIVERNNKIEKKNIKRIDKIRLEVYPKPDDIKPIEYLLFNSNKISISKTEGNKYWICYYDRCPIKSSEIKLKDNIIMIFERKDLLVYFIKWE